MPELPEVETTRRGIRPHVEGRVITEAVVREPRLRWPVPAGLPKLLAGKRIEHVDRRGKYLLLRTGTETLIIHLGMSGSLRMVDAGTPPRRHDHVDLCFEDKILRFHDPRRFGAILWTAASPGEHELLKHLGPEPLSDAFDGKVLYRCARQRRSAVKSLIMDGRVVVGVGNIYANEALFMAGIHPFRPSNRISAVRYDMLARTIKEVLAAAVAEGGTTLRDFVREDGMPGYFAQRLHVYGRAGAPCTVCAAPIKQRRLGQRSTFYCGRCQR